MSLVPSLSSHLWKTAGLAAILGLLLVLYIGLWRDPSHIPSAQIGQMAQKFNLTKLGDDSVISLDDYKGKWVMVNFWASWCGACRTEHSTLVQAGKDFATAQNIVLIGINYKDQKEKALRFLKRLGAFPYPSGQDPRGRTGIDYGVYGLPETYFINPEGKIFFRHVGAIKLEQIKKAFAPALKGAS